MSDRMCNTSIKKTGDKLISRNAVPHKDLNFDGYIKPFKDVSNLWWKNGAVMVVIIDRKVADDEKTDDDDEDHEITPYFFKDEQNVVEEMINKKNILNYRPEPVSKNQSKDPEFNDLCVNWYLND